MERFCKDLRDHAMKTINYEEKEIIPLSDKENKSYEMQKVCYICKQVQLQWRSKNGSCRLRFSQLFYVINRTCQYPMLIM